jgi:recombination protein RecA
LNKKLRRSGADPAGERGRTCRDREKKRRIFVDFSAPLPAELSFFNARKFRINDMAKASAASKKTTTAAPDGAKLTALQKALAQIEKNHGEGSIMRFNELDRGRGVEVIPVGAISVDAALGVGGFPRGRIVEVYGPESSGKTTLALHAVANAQAAGGVAAYVDAEHAMDPLYCRKLGVNVDEMLISQPDYGEQALDIVETLVESNSVDIIVVDSVAALVPKAEIEGEMGESFVGLQARLMSQALRKLTAAISRSKCVVIFINQLREKIGVMFGSPETQPGGRALKFYCTIRVDIRRIGAIKEGEVVVGNRTRVKIVKNKMAPPFREAEFDLLYGQGISIAGDLVDMAIKHNVIAKAGAWYNYGEVSLGQGRENAKRFLEDKPKLLKEIDEKVRMIVGLIPGGEALEAEMADAAKNKGKKTAAAKKGAKGAKESAEEAEAEPEAESANGNGSGKGHSMEEGASEEADYAPEEAEPAEV